MRKYILLMIVMLFSFSIKAQQKVVVHNSGNIMYTSSIALVDNIKLDNTYSKFKLSGQTS